MQELDNIKSSGKIRIGISLQDGIKSAPWAWKDEQTAIILGFEADIASAIAQQLNVTPEFISLDSYRLIIGLVNSSYDVAISALKSQNKMAGIIYTDPYYYLTQRIVTLEDSSVYDLVDLKGYKVGVLTKSLGEYIIQEENSNLPDPIKIICFSDVLELFTALQFKQVSAIFIDSPVALWHSKTNIDKQLKVSEIAYRSGSYSIGLRADCEELRNTINNALRNIDLREILDKYGLWDEAQESY